MPTNSIDVARTDTVVGSLSTAEKVLHKLSLDSIPGWNSYDNDVVPIQTDDLNSDNNWDEMASVIDITANEEKNVFFYAFAKAELPSFPKTRNVHFSLGKFQTVTHNKLASSEFSNKEDATNQPCYIISTWEHSDEKNQITEVFSKAVYDTGASISNLISVA
ncbi:DUF4861 family protein [Nonlabens sp. Hel1_33_55]|uniref:DUF4861 family protein n=1 Tax=Nonlabens sp. Hel1_33_55 TaxID=1336802 RepID=UPI0012FE1201|nr:DUF4861 family protein [Nonlabens sp. Hel1_33_55]